VIVSWRCVVPAVLVSALVAAGCSDDDPPSGGRRTAAASPAAGTAESAATSAAAGLRDVGSCAESAGFHCGRLVVPLDHKQPGGRTLDLAVAVEAEAPASRGVLLVLTGGPGQGGLGFVARLSERLGDPVLDAYRLVMFDQRGTGARALQCPAMQEAMGSSDLAPPPAEAVRSCADALGEDRRFYSTEDVVADIEALRTALGAGQLSLLGVSYGTFVAAHYAIAHPDVTARLVLDSVLPHDGIDPLSTGVFAAVPRVLTDACRAAARCTSDPVDDVREVVRRYGDGVGLLDLITTMSIVDPTFSELLPALAEAASGRPDELLALQAAYRDGSATAAEQLSQGLHASALCTDLTFPWGGSDAPLEGRQRALAAAAATARVDPFDLATATGTGFIQQCLPWPPTEPAGLPVGADLPAVPTLLLAGDRDLSTPMEWAQQELAHAPQGRIVVVPGAGHSVISRAGGGQEAVRDFLVGD